MNYALLDENGVVTNIIWLDPNNADAFPNAIRFDNTGVIIGDTYLDGIFYRNSERVKTNAELMADEFIDMGTALDILGVPRTNVGLEGAKKIKPYLQKAAQSLDDADSLHVKGIYPKWEELVELGSVEAEANTFKFLYGTDLYKCINANPTFQSDWVPGVGTESLYTRIDETHAGTLEDPIPYNGNMELTEGLYYIQYGQTYICTRDTGTAVHHALSDLVGLYVNLVS